MNSLTFDWPNLSMLVFMNSLQAVSSPLRTLCVRRTAIFLKSVIDQSFSEASFSVKNQLNRELKA